MYSLSIGLYHILDRHRLSILIIICLSFVLSYSQASPTFAEIANGFKLQCEKEDKIDDRRFKVMKLSQCKGPDPHFPTELVEKKLKDIKDHDKEEDLRNEITQLHLFTQQMRDSKYYSKATSSNPYHYDPAEHSLFTCPTKDPIVGLIEASQDPLAYRMDYAGGGDLFHHIAAKQPKVPRTQQQYWQIVLGSQEQLTVYHEKLELVHSDIKPENIVLKQTDCSVGIQNIQTVWMPSFMDFEMAGGPGGAGGQGTPTYLPIDWPKCSTCSSYEKDLYAQGLFLDTLTTGQTRFQKIDTLKATLNDGPTLEFGPSPKEFTSSDVRNKVKKVFIQKRCGINSQQWDELEKLNAGVVEYSWKKMEEVWGKRSYVPGKGALKVSEYKHVNGKLEPDGNKKWSLTARNQQRKVMNIHNMNPQSGLGVSLPLPCKSQFELEYESKHPWEKYAWFPEGVNEFDKDGCPWTFDRIANKGFKNYGQCKENQILPSKDKRFRMELKDECTVETDVASSSRQTVTFVEKTLQQISGNSAKFQIEVLQLHHFTQQMRGSNYYSPTTSPNPYHYDPAEHSLFTCPTKDPIVGLIEASQDPLAYRMDYAGGGDLRAYIKGQSSAKYTPQQYWQIVLGSQEQITVYHETVKLVHNNIKPDNIVLKRTDCGVTVNGNDNIKTVDQQSQWMPSFMNFQSAGGPGGRGDRGTHLYLPKD